MTVDEFHRAITDALSRHFPQATLFCFENRGVVLSCRVEWNTDMFISVYFNALTQKTSYALIQGGRRITGYDNYKFWHFHPPGRADQHIPCAEPTPEEVFMEFVGVIRKSGTG